MTKKKMLIAISLLFVVILFFLYSASFSFFIDNGTRIEENSNLTYYLDVVYDGKDKNIITSSETATADIRSGYIFVQDKLPDGLIFEDFVRTPDGTIGAVQQGDNSKSCSGYVIGGVEGLAYTSSNRTINFSIENLQAGCKITVGIVTKTPALEDKLRLDFYNTAFGYGKDFSIYSNTVHSFLGDEESLMYPVNYTYIGDVPEGAPELPSGISYSKDSSISVANVPVLQGYSFEGWSTSDVSINNDMFLMPDHKVEFQGRFIKKETYDVAYSISGEMPDDYLPPVTKKYGVSDFVEIDSLKEGTIIGKYKFKGWDLSNFDFCYQGELDEKHSGKNFCVISRRSVDIVGSFEEVKYNVEYKFKGDVIPENFESLIPPAGSYYAGDTVKLADYPTANGYKFLGWYSDDNFKMPEENLIIYGEWAISNGGFSPEIVQEVEEEKEYYAKDEQVVVNTMITNTEAYPIYEVLLESNLDGLVFSGGNIAIDNYVLINTIEPGETVIVPAIFTVGDDWVKNYTSKIEVVNALAFDGYRFDSELGNFAATDFAVSNIAFDINVVNENGNKVDNADFALYTLEDDKPILTGLDFKKLIPGTSYYLKQTNTDGGYVMSEQINVLIDEEGKIEVSGAELVNDNNKYTINVVNKKINMLPQTGGSGNVPYVLCGVFIILIGGSIYLIYRKYYYIEVI